MSKRLVIIALACLCSANNGMAAGIDCKAASTDTERMICKSPQLSRRDGLMSKLYDAATARDATQREKQREWLAGVRSCRDAACLAERYDVRIGELLNSQGGQAVATHFFSPTADGNSGALSIFGPENGLAAVSIAATYVGSGGAEAGDVNADRVDGVTKLAAGHGTLRRGHCVIQLRRTDPATWRVEQNGRCSTVSGVTFAGIYRR